MKFQELSPEVLVSDQALITLTRADLAELKNRVATTSRRRVRLCAHRGVDDAVHEMIIALARDCYLRPHRHVAKSESFHLIEGEMDVVLFEEDGRISGRVCLSNRKSGSAFFYRNDTSVIHTVLVHSAVVVFHETTRGPFRATDNVLAEWAPDENDIAAVSQFLRKLRSGGQVSSAIRGDAGSSTGTRIAPGASR